jgi:hypothetical protein
VQQVLKDLKDLKGKLVFRVQQVLRELLEHKVQQDLQEHKVHREHKVQQVLKVPLDQ